MMLIFVTSIRAYWDALYPMNMYITSLLLKKINLNLKLKNHATALIFGDIHVTLLGNWCNDNWSNHDQFG